jgi:hypothetical protein
MTFTEQYAKEHGLTLEEAKKDIKGWLSYKSNKDRWIEEQEEEEEC